MKLVPHILFDEITGFLILNVYNIWGGCRAGGRHGLVLPIKLPSTEYKLHVQEIQVESDREYEELTNKKLFLNKKN